LFLKMQKRDTTKISKPDKLLHQDMWIKVILEGWMC
jgi:hypothetical protein